MIMEMQLAMLIIVSLFFQWGYSCFTMLFQFLQCNEVNQLYECIQPCPPHHPTLGQHRVLLYSTLCAVEQVPTTCQYYMCVYIYIHTHIHMPMLIQFIPSLPSLVSTCRFSMSLSLSLPCKQVHQYHFSRFCVYALIYDTCFFLTYFNL